MTALERGAVHEAAHCVLAFRFDLDVLDVQLNRDGSGLMRYQIPRRSEGESDYAWQRKCAKQAVMAIAGVIADRKYSGRGVASPLDLRCARRWLGELHAERALAEETAISVTRKLLDQPRTWSAVKVLAGHLVKRRRLTGADVERICRTCGIRT